MCACPLVWKRDVQHMVGSQVAGRESVVIRGSVGRCYMVVIIAYEIVAFSKQPLLGRVVSLKKVLFTRIFL